MNKGKGKYTHLDYKQRVRLEVMVEDKCTVVSMAKRLNCARSTIYRELALGAYTHMRSDLTTYTSYSAQKAQTLHDLNATAKGAPLKVGNDYAFVAYCEDKIVNHMYSPDAVIGEIKRKGLQFKGMVSTRTLYNYIDSGFIFENVTRQNLCNKGEKKNKYIKVHRAPKVKRARSISDRPEDVLTREEFGHWEMDTVKGKQGTKETLLVLTERKTRYELVRKLPDGRQESVIKVLDSLEKNIGSFFSSVFKTITVDNGSEFLDHSGLEKSIHDGIRTLVYFCNPFSSFERGSNENANKIIRRFIPKGEVIGNYTDSFVQNMQGWINNYPRRLLEYASAAELFMKEAGFLLA